MVDLDSIDRRILRHLQADGRMSVASLADAVGLTPTPLRSRLDKLRQRGVLLGVHGRVDAVQVGQGALAFIHVTLRDHSRTSHERFVDGVTAMPEVLEVHHIAGEEDFLLKVVGRDLAAFESFLLERLTPIESISRIKTTFVLSSAKKAAPIPIPDCDQEVT